MNTTPSLLYTSEIEAVARHCAFVTGLDAEDLMQEFAMVLIERAGQLEGSTKGYIKRRLRWTASHLAEKDDARTRLNVSLSVSAGDGNDDGDLDVVDANALSPEEIYLRREERALELAAIRDALAVLTPRQQAIVRGLMRGEMKMDLAGKHGISKAMISKEVAAIRGTIELVLR